MIPRVRQGQRRDREVLLAGHPEDGAAGDERLHPRTGAQQGGDVRRGIDDLLEVVEHQQEVSLPQRRGELLRRRTAGELAQVQGVGDRRDTRSGSRTAARETKTTPSANAVSSSLATSIASRVLPTPPGPVSVTSRISGRRSRSHTAARSRSRPTSGVSGMGRVLARGRGGALTTARNPLGRSSCCP